MYSPAAEGIGFLRRAERFSSVLNEHDLSLIYRRHPTQERRQVTRSHGQLQARSRAPAHYVRIYLVLHVPRSWRNIVQSRTRPIALSHKIWVPKIWTQGPYFAKCFNIICSAEDVTTPSFLPFFRNSHLGRTIFYESSACAIS